MYSNTFTILRTASASTPGYVRSLLRTAATSARSLSTAAEGQSVDGPAVSQTNRAQASLKRFWKKVDIEEVQVPENEPHLVVKLDKRALKTPSGNVLALPKSKRLAASLVAHEWDSQATLIKPHALLMTSLVSRAIDGLRERDQRAEVRQALLKYLDTDTICYHEEQPPALVRLQEKHWFPLLDKMRSEFGVQINVIGDILLAGQPPSTKRIFDAVVEDFDEWELAALERSTYSTKSFLTALALVRGYLSVDEAADVAQVEVLSQIETWGEVEDSHDVDHRDIRRQLGSAASLLVDV